MGKADQMLVVAAYYYYYYFGSVWGWVGGGGGVGRRVWLPGPPVELAPVQNSLRSQALDAC
jgi:hypothetical protein